VTGHKVFPAGATLSSGDVNGYLMDQTVAVFDNAFDRNTQWADPPDGAHSYLLDTRMLETYQEGAVPGTEWQARQSHGVLARSRTDVAFAAGNTVSAEYAITGLAVSTQLYPGRTYRMVVDLLMNAAVANQRCAIYVRGRTSLITPGPSDPNVATFLAPLPIAGTNGRTEVVAQGVFAVGSSDIYTLQPMLLHATAGQTGNAALGTSRGYMEAYVEDVGPQLSDLPLLV
jgi:hypothetical protein